MRPSAIHLAAADHFSDRFDSASLQLAVQHYRAAREWLKPAHDLYNAALMDEGDTRRRLAELGVDPLYNLEQAIEHAQQGGAHFHADSEKQAKAMMNEGVARDLLAELGVAPETNLQTAVALYRRARSLAVPGSELFASTQVNEVTSHVYLSDLGVHPIESLHTAVQLCESARTTFAAGSAAAGLTFLNEGNARRGLAEWGEAPVENLRVAVAMLHQAQGCCEAESYNWQLAASGEAGARQELAEHGVEPVANLEEALAIRVRLGTRHPPGTLPHAEHNNLEAILHIALARHGIQPLDHLSAAVELSRGARQGFDPTGHTHAQSCTSEGNARLLLARFSIDRELNLQTALALYEESARPHEPGSAKWAVARRNAARSLWLMGRFQEAYDRIAGGLDNLETRRAALFTERERVAFAETVAGQYQDAAEICLAAMDQETDEARRVEWRLRAWHQVHCAKNRALFDLLQGARPRLREPQQPLWDEIERLSRELHDCERRMRGLQRHLGDSPAPDAAASSLADMRQERTRLIRLLEDRRREALGEIEDASTFLSAEVPPARVVHEELRLLAAQRGGAGHRTLLVELFLVDTGTVLAFLAPLWEVDALEVERIPLPPGFAARLATDFLAESTTNARDLMLPSGGGARLVESPAPRIADLLARMSALVEPWAERLDELRPSALLLAPHSYLSLLPLHAVPVQDRPLIERVPVAYLPSPTLAGSLRRECAKPMTTALLIGDPISDLPGARQEVSMASRQIAAAGITVRTLSHHKATSGRVRQYAPRAGILHFACHAAIDHADFLGSGLVLNDRRLTVLEVMAALALTDTSLVYLGSCDSARPAVGHTEELMALARSFLYAGSPTVIASQWPLNDDSGRVFAQHFYSAWMSPEQPVSLIRAFQHAMLRTRDEMPHPLRWAPFALIGAW
jgi:hypothetical protein